MTVSNDMPDWRDRISRSSTRPNPDLHAVPQRKFWSTEGVVTSELEAPWYTHAGGTRGLLNLALLTYLAALAVSGQLAGIVTAILAWLAPLVALVLILVVLTRMLPGGGLISTALIGAGIRGVGGFHRHASPVAPGRQITLVRPPGDTEEVLVASSRRLPAGTPIRVIGPRLLGRRHAWFVRSLGGSLIASRGVTSSVVVSPVLLTLSALTLIMAVAR